jgi:ABC-type dipeptide/oligopeptide/nickel transport system permease component
MHSEYARMAEAKGLRFRVVHSSTAVRSDLELLKRLVDNW